MTLKIHDRSANVILLTTVVEFCTALALLIAPAFVVELLLGRPADATAQIVARCLGITLLALAAAWWPDRTAATSVHPYFRGRLLYNTLIALLLAYSGALDHTRGLLLWPAVGIHAVIALLLVSERQARRRRETMSASSDHAAASGSPTETRV